MYCNDIHTNDNLNLVFKDCDFKGKYMEALQMVLYCTYNKILSQCGKYSINPLQICSSNIKKHLHKYSLSFVAPVYKAQALKI